jgi:hypothetical protein
VEAAPGPSEIALIGSAANGLRVRRRIRLAEQEPLVRTETAVENTAVAPIEVAVQSRIEADPAATYEDLVTAFRAQDGSGVEQPLLRPEEQPSGAESYTGARLPDGEWRIVDRRGGTALAVQFRNEQVARANLSWTAKAQKRVTLDVWSKPRVLAPGERLELEASYGIYYRP